MNRTALLRLIAVLFLIYGLYNALLLPGMFVAPVPILLAGTLAKVLLALAAAVGVWTGQRWAPAIIVLTGAVVAALWLTYAFVLGIVAYLYAIGVAAVAVVLMIAVAGYVQRGRSAFSV
ncbi:MAG TPA: hypothetical protein VLV86_05990 [Vicinamibacterales bacterium]|nr:hypothetical protein [Vicinamibacterales bacterium]